MLIRFCSTVSDSICEPNSLVFLVRWRASWGKQFQFRVSVSVGEAKAAALVYLDYFGGGRASVCAVGGMEMGMLFHAMMSVIREQCGAEK